jgi:hypothetical protein
MPGIFLAEIGGLGIDILLTTRKTAMPDNQFKKMLTTIFPCPYTNKPGFYTGKIRAFIRRRNAEIENPGIETCRGLGIA